MSDACEKRPDQRLFQLFLAFLRVGVTAFGGPGMIAQDIQSCRVRSLSPGSCDTL